MPDPLPGKGIELRLDQSADRAALQKAKEACQQYNPQANGPAAADPQAAEKARRFAECMRANKVEDFAEVDVADDAVARRAFDVQFLHHPLLHQRDAGFLGGEVDEKFLCHEAARKS
jgi:hypothetical protein